MSAGEVPGGVDGDRYPQSPDQSNLKQPYMCREKDCHRYRSATEQHQQKCADKFTHEILCMAHQLHLTSFIPVSIIGLFSSTIRRCRDHRQTPWTTPGSSQTGRSASSDRLPP